MNSNVSMKSSLVKWLTSLLVGGITITFIFQIYVQDAKEHIKMNGSKVNNIVTSLQKDQGEDATTSNQATKSQNLLTIFTTFKSDISKLRIYKNTLQNWKRLSTSNISINYILFVTNVTDTSLKKLAYGLGWKVLNVPRVNKHGTPYLKEMFQTAQEMSVSAFYGFSNGDILFGAGLVPTLLQIHSNITSLNRTLVIGTRSNVLIKNKELYDPKKVDDIVTSEGKPASVWAEDYFFIAYNDFPWSKVPDIVVGRPAYDNFLVGMAIQNKVSVVDATQTVKALHQTDKEGDSAGHSRKNQDVSHNNRVIGKFNYEKGLISKSQFKTMFVNRSSNYIEIVKRT